MTKWYYIILLVIAIQYSFPKDSNPLATENKPLPLSNNIKFEIPTDSTKVAREAKKRLSKAKLEKNWKHITLAYKDMLFQVPKNQMLVYCDSMIEAATNTNDKKIIGEAYLKKGIIHYERKELDKALDNYIVANANIIQTEDEYLWYKVKYSIAHTKYYLGFYEEAIALFTECITYFKEENDRAYLNSLHSLGLCYNKIGSFDKCTNLNTLGIEKGIEFNNNEMEMYFIHSEGINQYYKRNYKLAINKLKTSLIEISKRKDFGNVTVGNFYIAKSYWELNQIESAVPFLLKVDETISQLNYARPDLRENYELLIKYYKQKKDSDKQLHFVNKLLRTDSILNKNYKYLSNKVFKEYDTTTLQHEKEEITTAINLKYKVSNSIAMILIIISIYITYQYNKNQKYYKRKFEELMVKDNSLNSENSKNLNSEEIDIKPEIVAAILKNIEKFEKNKKYLDKDMSLSKIATILHTNTKYASKVIFKYRNKKTIEYINDLKIDFIVDLLKSEKKYRLYTNKALSEEAGFGSTQNFTKAFNSRTGIAPTYFIKNLK